MDRRLVGLVTTIVLLGAAPAQATFQWSPSQPLDESFSMDRDFAASAILTVPRLALTTDGTALLSGTAAGTEALVVRPRGGAPGAPQSLPAGLTGGTFTVPAIAGIDNGDALFANTNYVAFRPAGIAVGTPQNVGSGGFHPSAIDTAPTGEALVTADDDVRVAFRPAGPLAQVDVANAQDFHVPGRVRGVSLDPSGAAVVVWTSLNTLYQAVRPAGAASFNAPTILANPAGVSGGQAKLAFASAASGHAVMVWLGYPSPDPGDFREPFVIATTRAPGGGFGAPAIIATSSYDTNSPAAAITSTGAGLVTWDDQSAAMTNPTAKASFISGGVFSGAAAFDGTSFELAAASAGPDLAVITTRRAGNDAQGVLIRYSGAGGALAVVEELPLPLDPGPQASPVYLAIAGSPTGGFVAVHQDGFATGGQFKTSVRVGEDLDAVVPPAGGGGDPPAGGTGAPPPGGGTQTPTTPRIAPIVPKNLVVPAPIYTKTPSFQASCPRAGSECLVALTIYAAFGAIPASTKHPPKKAAVLGTASVKVKPGKSATAKVHLTSAGRTAARSKHAQKVRVVISVTRGTEHKQQTVAFTLKPGSAPKKKKH